MSERSDTAPAPAPATVTSQAARQPAARKRTPRVPSNTLYNRIVPIAIGVLVIVLLAVLVAVVLGVGAGY